MGVYNYHTAERLSEHLAKSDRRKFTGGQHVLEHISGTNARQLIRVADQNYSCTELECPQQRVEQCGVYHRHFVDYNGVGIYRISFIFYKDVFFFIVGGPDLEQPVHRFCFPAGKLGHPLCRTTGRRGKRDLHPSVFHDLYYAVYGCGLSGSRSACKYKYA